MPLSYFPDHRDRLFTDLLSQFRSRPRLAALVAAIALGVQDVEDETLDALLSFRLDSAIANQLDLLAAIVGEQRGGLDDEQLRRIVLARVLANRSNGSLEDVWRVFTRATTGPDPADFTTIQDNYPASFTLEVSSVRRLTDEERRRARRLVMVAKPAGVGVRLVASEIDSLRFRSRASGLQSFDGPLFSSLF